MCQPMRTNEKARSDHKYQKLQNVYQFERGVLRISHFFTFFDDFGQLDLLAKIQSYLAGRKGAENIL